MASDSGAQTVCNNLPKLIAKPVDHKDAKVSDMQLDN